jgi:AcrR family transcriptional regulator
MTKLITTCAPLTISDIGGETSATRLSLISTGEKLLGEAGLAGAALHKIAEAAGQGNKYAVQYHFGDLKGLCDAIFETRQGQLERRREALIHLLHDAGLEGTLGGLLQVLYIPVAEQIDEDGRHSYARFVLQYLIRPQYSRHSDPRTGPRTGLTGQLYTDISKLIGLSFDDAVSRLYIANYMMYAALIDYDNLKVGGQTAPSLDVAVSHSLRLIQAALRA